MITKAGRAQSEKIVATGSSEEQVKVIFYLQARSKNTKTNADHKGEQRCGQVRAAVWTGEGSGVDR